MTRLATRGTTGYRVRSQSWLPSWRNWALQNLDSICNTNIQSNETAISSARMLTACRDVDQRIQTLAAASEEMVASIGQIGGKCRRCGRTGNSNENEC